LKILEPTTTFTDYILAGETLVLGILLLKTGAANSAISVRLWGFAFITTAIGAAAGGTYHGFIESLGKTAPAVWKISVYAIGITAWLMLSASALSALSGTAQKIVLAAALMQLAFYAWWMAGHNDFKYVIYDYAPAMILILILQILSFSQGGAGSVWIIGGLVLSFAGAAVQQSGFSLHRNFNFNDIFHVIQMVAMYFLYRGGNLLKDFRI
jgi:uncharacterized protein DUF6962